MRSASAIAFFLFAAGRGRAALGAAWAAVPAGAAGLLAAAYISAAGSTVTGLPAGQPCILVTVSQAGAAVAGTWTAGYDGTAEITGASAIPVSQLTALHIDAPSHRLLLTIPL